MRYAPAMRVAPALLFALAAAGCEPDPDPQEAPAFCADVAEQNEGCWTEELDQDCLDVYAECGEEIVIMESCPVQLACA